MAVTIGMAFVNTADLAMPIFETLIEYNIKAIVEENTDKITIAPQKTTSGDRVVKANVSPDIL